MGSKKLNFFKRRNFILSKHLVNLPVTENN